MNPRKTLTGAAAVFLTITAAGLAGGPVVFPTIRIAGVYILEVLFILTALAVAFSETWRVLGPFKEPGKHPLLPSFLFFLWGCVLFVLDHKLSERVVLHAVLLIYPFLWTMAGYWLLRANPKYAKFLVFTVFALGVTEQMVAKRYYLSLSVGSLAILAYMLFLDRLLKMRKLTWSVFLIVPLTIAAFIEFWQPWWDMGKIQRTTLIATMTSLAGVPMALNFRNPRKALAPIAAAMLLFLGGVALGIVATTGQDSLRKTMVDRVYTTMQHPDDFQHDQKTKEIVHTQLFAFRDRRYWWSRAIAMWKTSPVIGVGFVPEIPDVVRDQFKNDGIFKGTGDFEFNERIVGKPFLGPHNSYLTILARSGVVGFGIFCFMLLSWANALRGLFTRHRFEKVFSTWDQALFTLNLIFVPVSGLMFAMFQVGLESPRTCTVLWLYMGMTLALARE